MFRSTLLALSAIGFAAIAAGAAAQGLDGGPKQGATADVGSPDRLTGGQSYGDRNRGGGAGFYAYPGGRSLDRAPGGAAARPLSGLDAGTSPYCHRVNCHGSAWYGPDYGAPYHGGSHVDRGVLYRDPRDR